MNDFLFFDSWFDLQFSAKSSCRFPTFKIALNLLNQFGGSTIVETGTTRLPNDWGAGMSTLLFGEYVKRYGGTVTTVDISLENILVCKSILLPYQPLVEFVVSDSHAFLKGYSGKSIDLLYLDSLDYPIDGTDGTPSQEHNRTEFILAEPHLSKRCVLLLDDNNLPGGGKTKLTKEHLLTKPEWVCVYESQQSVWMRL